MAVRKGNGMINKRNGVSRKGVARSSSNDKSIINGNGSIGREITGDSLFEKAVMLELAVRGLCEIGRDCTIPDWEGESIISTFMDFVHDLELYIYNEHMRTGYCYREDGELVPGVNDKGDAR